MSRRCSLRMVVASAGAIFLALHLLISSSADSWRTYQTSPDSAFLTAEDAEERRQLLALAARQNGGSLGVTGRTLVASY